MLKDVDVKKIPNKNIKCIIKFFSNIVNKPLLNANTLHFLSFQRQVIWLFEWTSVKWKSV